MCSLKVFKLGDYLFVIHPLSKFVRGLYGEQNLGFGDLTDGSVDVALCVGCWGDVNRPYVFKITWNIHFNLLSHPLLVVEALRVNLCIVVLEFASTQH